MYSAVYRTRRPKDLCINILLLSEYTEKPEREKKILTSSPFPLPSHM